MPSPNFDPTATGPSGLAIANHVGRLLSEYAGRGPTKARTSFGDDLVTVVVQDLLTKMAARSQMGVCRTAPTVARCRSGRNASS
jgi:uncharacterized protein YbcI